MSKTTAPRVMPSRDELEAGAWRDFAAYSSAKALTYLEDAPEGRGPWFVVGTFGTLLETADYDEALKAFEARA